MPSAGVGSAEAETLIGDGRSDLANPGIICGSDVNLASRRRPGLRGVSIDDIGWAAAKRVERPPGKPYY